MSQTPAPAEAAQISAPKASRRGGSRWKAVLLGLILPVVLIAFWEFATRSGLMPPHRLPAPSSVLQMTYDMATGGELWGHIGITLYRLFMGFLFGTALALILGVIVGSSRLFEQVLDPTLQAFRNVPALAWVPLFILWWGIGEDSKIILLTVGVFFPVYLNIVSGIQGVDRKLIEVGKVYGFTRMEIVRRIVLRAAMPSFLVGIRGGLGLGWMFVVAAELLGAQDGLGYLLTFGQSTSNPTLIVTSIVLFAVLGKLTDSILKQLEVRALHWQDRIGK